MMYLSIGNDMAVRDSSLIGIFDLDNATWSRWTREHGIHGHSKYTVENAHDFLCYCYHNRQLLSLIIASNQHTAIYEAFYQIMKPQFDNNATECYQSRFYSYGLFGLLGEWNRRNYQATPEEMTAIFFDFIQ